ncbi:kinase-like protein [Pluteus cervinus]|uniref:Kinase-like protein n=1 Tax=Pluteus cervinus TaxID=181527 RepID=A0ACD3AXI7_9AGAR|nr:kinase-like protein [Pluteus cervinus]
MTMYSEVEDVPTASYEVLEESPASIVARTFTTLGDLEPQWLVVKSATTYRKFSKEPHDIVKEARVLQKINHPNIIRTLKVFRDTTEVALKIWEPYIPFSLAQLLSSPKLSPHIPPPPVIESISASDQLTRFEQLTKSIIAQILSALAYLHDDERRIAHRDIKPNNILLTRDGGVQLIDFGIVYKESESEADKEGDLWPEFSDHMHFEVSTGPYRAPELLFGARTYDAMTIDLWSLGATFAEFFTPLKLFNDDIDEFEDDLEPSDDDEISSPFIVPKELPYSTLKWERNTLFNGTRGEIGLAWSIFKIRGTPNDENWPSFKDLSGARSVTFMETPTVKLAPFLPNLPPDEALRGIDRAPEHLPSANPIPSPLDLLLRFLIYPPSLRLRARLALAHPWLCQGSPILLPQSEVAEDLRNHPNVSTEDSGRTLGSLLGSILS